METAITHEAWSLGTDGDGGAGSATHPGREGWTGAARGEGLASALGWLGLGLGALEVLAPRRVGRMVGLEDGAGRSAIRMLGMREIGTGLGILAQPRSKEWMGSRVAGDLVDLALLAAILPRGKRRDRTLLAAGAVLGITVLDVLATERLSRSRRAPTEEAVEGSELFAEKAITIAAPRETLYAYWRDFGSLPRFMPLLQEVRVMEDGRSVWSGDDGSGSARAWEVAMVEDRPGEVVGWCACDTSSVHRAGRVTFEDGAREGETVVRVQLWYALPGGALGSAAARLLRKDPGQQLAADLRRLKQIMELGEIVRSDASLTAHPRPARPIGADEVRA